MSTTEKLTVPYGCSRGLPDGVRVAWGARLVAPADLLHDRQGCAGGTDGCEERQQLLSWLSGGAGDAARAKLREGRYGMPMGLMGGGSQDIETVYDDGVGCVVASPQGSHGYVYIAAWLIDHVGEAPTPIPALAEYKQWGGATGDGNPIVAQVFTGSNGWQDTPTPGRRCTVDYLKRLRDVDGVERIAARINDDAADPVGTLADFTVRELLESAGCPA